MVAARIKNIMPKIGDQILQSVMCIFIESALKEMRYASRVMSGAACARSTRVDARRAWALTEDKDNRRALTDKRNWPVVLCRVWAHHPARRRRRQWRRAC